MILLQVNYTRKLGRTGIKVFPLGFGGIPIQRLNTREAVKIVRAAVKLGINFIDTARAYSDSEEKIGLALENVEKKIFLATKTPKLDKKGSLNDIKISLDRLKVSSIDIYQLHGINDRNSLKEVMKSDGALSGLKQAKKAGKIKHIAITGHNNEILLEALETGDFSTVQFCYNYIENDCEEKLIDYCLENDIGMIAMKPLAGGRLENPAVALKYVLSKEGIIPDPGMETIEEVKENMEIAQNSWELNQQEKELIQKDIEKLGTQFCRRCDYCQPCPEEISISAVLRAESFINRMPAQQINDKEGWIYKSFKKAENCTNCRQCVERCPYDLPVPELIDENIEIMSDFLLKQTRRKNLKFHKMYQEKS